MNKIITVDIGNSNIVVGILDKALLEVTGRLQTKRDYTEKELRLAIWDLINKKTAYEGAILSSVVPEITQITLTVLEEIVGKNPLLMNPDLQCGIDFSDYAKGAIGMDRIVDLSAAVAMYGAPVMVCDLGTCTTITVAKNSDIEAYSGKLFGGMICPGVQLSLDAQAQRASQLPQLKAKETMSLLGTDTASNMMSGAVAGCGLMISELANRLNDSELKVVITGGFGKLVMPWISTQAKVYYEPDLLLRGLYEIYLGNCNQ